MEIGAGRRIRVSDVVEPYVLKSRYVHLAPMRPEKVLRMVRGLKKALVKLRFQ